LKCVAEVALTFVVGIGEVRRHLALGAFNQSLMINYVDDYRLFEEGRHNQHTATDTDTERASAPRLINFYSLKETDCQQNWRRKKRRGLRDKVLFGSRRFLLLIIVGRKTRSN
jgi:hypothetical protein